MNKSFYSGLLIGLLFILPDFSYAQERVQLSLEEIVARAKSRSPAALRAETRRENRYWNYRFFRSNYNPQLRLGGTVPGFSQAVNTVIQPDGSIGFREVRQNLMDVELGMQQVIGATGGVISVNSSTNRFDNFLAPEGIPQTQWSGVPVNVRLSQPIFAFNPWKWDKKIEPLLYEESKREFVEEMEEISTRVTQLFFDFLIAQVNFEIATKNLNNTQEILKIEQGRYNIGTTYEDKLLQVELQVLQARQDLAQARLDLEANSLRLKAFVGINETAELTLIPPKEVPEFEIRVEEAIEFAFQNRAEALGFDRRVLQAESQVAEARGQRFNMNFNASYGLNNAALQWQDIFIDPNRQTLVNLGFFVPVLDWGRNKARMGQAQANKRLVEYTVEQDMINFEQEIFTKVRNFAMLKDRLEITKLSDEVADKRYEISLRRYQNGNVTITDLNIAQEEKDRNRRAYIQSLRDFWTAYYEMRQLTLYDFESGQLLYVPDLEER
ncbi:TolC family protein [Cecembia lonarensis]|uniref:Type I secretion outer membrane protein, TolC family n=1 Tax=Cecembia lonarensis (strain CCUG 58316 / KCTC 22772 / LW9) TaxID=1225176 RepID=K1KTL1_CECL9|nr:TolC family protein [Cecembia lonarensis]EKB47530.1 type I secretion outer membrane protein, TolC family [Cecembia lonarensis LW9]